MEKIVRFRDTKSNRVLNKDFIGKNLKVMREMGGNCSCGVFGGRSEALSGTPHLHWCDSVSMDIELPTGEMKRVYYEDVDWIKV